MNKLFLHISLCLFLFTGIQAQEEIITLKTKTGEIEGTLKLPEEKSNLTLVLIHAGSGPTDRNGNSGEAENNSLKYISDELSKSGIASLRYDKRGVARSQDAMKEEYELKFDTYVNDLTEWINLIAKDKRFTKIIVAGHSEGSLIGMIASSKNKNVKSFISIAGAGRPADVLIKEQLATVPKNIQDAIFPMLDQIKKGDTVENVPPIFYSLLRPSVQPYMNSWFKYDPCLEIKKLKMPVLIIQGTTDIQVTEKDAELLSKAQPKAELKIIKDMNHVLKDMASKDKETQKPTYSDPTLALNKEFVTVMIEFVKKK